MDVAGIGKVHAVTSIQLNVDIPRRQNLILTIHHASNAKRLSADGIVSFFFVVVGREYHGNDRPGRQIHRQTATRGGERPVPRKYPRVYEAEEAASIIIDDVVARMGPFEMFSRASRFRIDVRVFLLLFLFFFFFFFSNVSVVSAVVVVVVAERGKSAATAHRPMRTSLERRRRVGIGKGRRRRRREEADPMGEGRTGRRRGGGCGRRIVDGWLAGRGLLFGAGVVAGGCGTAILARCVVGDGVSGGNGESCLFCGTFGHGRCFVS
mmetsp:Transcript_1364/g.3180  ORF Transcript_1364/g.3180 Transcript_1364/m.3180 type:complete len:266 (-) Transcript_1364:14-811(-)